jgi:hypothetical protein
MSVECRAAAVAECRRLSSVVVDCRDLSSTSGKDAATLLLRFACCGASQDEMMTKRPSLSLGA